ncbi:ATP-binding protein [Haloarcula nitratireducens]|uniref:ATP-binding protein n=1 Tax=Haloarcula nitratireducens TaxID=2487749 RepID=A0AAW4PF86_9EURY|nr:ATP-binding protein [Halomicroarcula nitratireducens]MBX0296717.1 ATP-binding protein [Halomicroarcula nitratireducens]
MADTVPPTDSDLPVVAESTQTYVRIQPATKALDPVGIERQLRRLHRLETQSTGRFSGLLGTAQAPLIEWLLVGDSERLAYYVSVDPDSQLDSLEGVLRGLFPESYAFERVRESRKGLLSGILEALEDDSSTNTQTEPPAAIEFERRCEHPKDWQTRLTPFEAFYESDDDRIPLSGVVETIANSPAPVVFQVLCRRKPDWSTDLEMRRLDIESGSDTLGGALTNAVFGRPEDPESIRTKPDEVRLAELDERDPRNSFEVNVRAFVGSDPGDGRMGRTPTDIARDLETAFGPVGHTTYTIAGRVRSGDDTTALRRAIEERTFRTRANGLANRLPWSVSRSPTLVADASEVGGFCLLDGAKLTAAGRRLADATPVDRQPLAHPPQRQLDRYYGPGLPLGHPLTQDSAPDPSPVSLPPTLQSLHLAWFGKTGSGKSTSLVTAMLDNHEATDGADILIDPKGDGMPLEYMQAHYERYGTLEDVLYFDCAELLPAFSFFDIRDELDRGIARTTAVEDRVEHYIEILIQLMGRDRFEQAVRSPDIIRYMVKAMFDPVSGADAFSHRDFHGAIQEMHDRNTAPPVSDGDLERMLAGVVANRARTFDEIMQGVANRIEKVPVDPRLARLFNHVPERGTDSTDPHFDLVDYLDEDVVIIFDTGQLRSEAQRALALLVLSNLWSALKRRARGSMNAEDPNASASEDAMTGDETMGTEDGTRPLVNVYIEEAASIAVSSLLSELLSQSRSFDCALTLAMQFPAQLRESSERAYQEVLNNVSTIVTGNVAVDEKLTRRLATDEMDAREVGNRLRALRRGQWFVSLPAEFDTDEPTPFTARSLPPPCGHPASTMAPQRRGFEEALTMAHQNVVTTAGLRLIEPSPAEGAVGQDEGVPIRADSALPYTNRLPSMVLYDASRHGLVCDGCESRYDPDSAGMLRAIECCASLDRVDPDDIPICEVNLKLSTGERDVSEFSDRQLMFLQAVYNAQQLRYDPPEYDLLYDSMLRLQEYLGIESEAIQDLIDDGLLTHDTDRPHRLYTVTPAGRSLIGEHYRKGIDYGHGKGDLEETSQHVLAVEVGRRYLVSQYENDPDSSVVRVVPYFELDERDQTAVPASSAMGGDSEELVEAADEYDRHRIDAVGLDAEGRVVVTLEAERVNHDLRRAVPEDFDKMAACDPDEAIWITMSHSEAHRVLRALNDPLEGEPRVEKTYAESTPASEFRIDSPGCTAMFTLEQVREMVAEQAE